jgi:hypothetical protein
MENKNKKMKAEDFSNFIGILPSRFQIGDEVEVNGRIDKVAAVKFTESKVYYGFDDDSLSLALYDSLDVKPIA